jgi:EpsD family peptidyl-prolyl cis-trans isomerase
MNSHRFDVLFAALILVSATACREKEQKPPSQVVARVNGEEITVHQINFALARAKGVTQDSAPQARREILEALIERQIARQQAAQRALDRSASVILEIEDARSAILARAFRESLVAYLPKPAPFEIKAYYRQHPELFAKRRVFDLEELAFVANAETIAELRSFLSPERSLTQVADWLQAKGIKASAHRGVRAAELIPLDMLPRISAMNDGDAVLFEGEGGRCRVMRLVASKLAPLDEESAVALINQYLTNRRSAEAVAERMKQLRGAATVEYLGEFANPAPKAGATRGAAPAQGGAAAKQPQR